jgi:hypothetical protein
MHLSGGIRHQRISIGPRGGTWHDCSGWCTTVGGSGGGPRERSAAELAAEESAAAAATAAEEAAAATTEEVLRLQASLALERADSAKLTMELAQVSVQVRVLLSLSHTRGVLLVVVSTSLFLTSEPGAWLGVCAAGGGDAQQLDGHRGHTEGGGHGGGGAGGTCAEARGCGGVPAAAGAGGRRAPARVGGQADGRLQGAGAIARMCSRVERCEFGLYARAWRPTSCGWFK